MNTGRNGSAVHRLLAALLIVLLAGALVASAQGNGDGQGAAGGTIANNAMNGATIYIDWEATGGDDGSSWDNAFTDLQDGLAAAGAGDEVWVAAGTYYPGTTRDDSFAMVNQVAIYGGFDPTEGDVGWDDCDWEANETILSGDIGVPDDNSDNCYHVFYHPSGTNLNSSAILDGFTVTGGNGENGDGMYNRSSSPTLTNCTFEGNTAGTGGGMYNDGSSPTLTNCTFEGNSATGDGGGMINAYESEPTVSNCILWGDTPGEIAGYLLAVTYSDIQGGYPGTGNIDADPLFVDPGSGDYHLGVGSPCIDACTNAAPDLPPYDFEGHRRILDGDGDGTAIVDMGVDELFLPVAYVYLSLVLKNP